MQTERDRAIAMAGIFQASRLVRDLAQEGRADARSIRASVDSIYRMDADSTLEVFGELSQLRLGLRTLVDQLAGGQRDMPITRYVINLIALQYKLAKQPDRLAALGSDLQALIARRDGFDFGEETEFSQLADIYQSHLSNLPPRIVVAGERTYLEGPDKAARIRTLLLAGLRAAHLWRQCGGRRLAFPFQRRIYVMHAESMLVELDEQADI